MTHEEMKAYVLSFSGNHGLALRSVAAHFPDDYWLACEVVAELRAKSCRA